MYVEHFVDLIVGKARGGTVRRGAGGLQAPPEKGTTCELLHLPGSITLSPECVVCKDVRDT